MPSSGVISLAGRTAVYRVLQDNTPVYADRPCLNRPSSSSRSSSFGIANGSPSSFLLSPPITFYADQHSPSSSNVKPALLLRRGDLVEVWSDRAIPVTVVDDDSSSSFGEHADHNHDATTASGSTRLDRGQRQSPRPRPRTSCLRYAPLTNDVGWISLSDAAVQQVDISRHPVRAFYVDNYPVGQCGLRQPIDRPDFRHQGCWTTTTGGTDVHLHSHSGTGAASAPMSDSTVTVAAPGQRHHHHHHYVPGQVVFSCRSVKSGRARYYRIQRVPFPSSAAAAPSPSPAPSNASTHSHYQHHPHHQPTDSVWLVDSRPREAHEEHPHDDVTLLMPFDKVRVDGGPFPYACLQTIELRTRPDHCSSSRSGRYLLKGDVCVASLVRQSPFEYGNGPFGLLSSHAAAGLWCFEKINNSPPLLVPLDVERGDWKLRVRSRAALPVLRQPVRQAPLVSAALPPGPPPGEEEEEEERCLSATDATGSAHVVRLLRRNETVRSDARFESPSTGAWFYRVVGLPTDHADAADDAGEGNDEQVSDDVEVGWVPDRSPNGRILLVHVRDDASLGEGGLACENQNDDAAGDHVQPWSMDFVRGVAAIASRTVREVSAQPDRQRIIFLQGSIMIHVFLATQTVEIEESTSQTIVQQRHCTPHQLSLILQNPLDALRSRSTSSDASVTTELDPPMSHEEEMKIRQRLADCDDELESVLEKRRELLEVLRPVEPMRRGEAIARLGVDPMESDSSGTPNPSPPPPVPDSMVLHTASSSPPRLEAQAPGDSGSGRRTSVAWEDLPLVQHGDANEPPVVARRGPPSETWDQLAATPTIQNFSRKRLDTPEATNDQQPLQLLKPHKEEEYEDREDERSSAAEVNDNGSSDGTALSSLGEQLNRTCGVCNQRFETARARSVHCLKEHGKFSCNYCPEVFDYVTLMHRHRDQENHW